jgi:hypothetical protein
MWEPRHRPYGPPLSVTGIALPFLPVCNIERNFKYKLHMLMGSVYHIMIQIFMR